MCNYNIVAGKLLKDETGATIRCFPLEQPGGEGKCLLTGNTATRVALFAKAY